MSGGIDKQFEIHNLLKLKFKMKLGSYRDVCLKDTHLYFCFCMFNINMDEILSLRIYCFRSNNIILINQIKWYISLYLKVKMLLF